LDWNKKIVLLTIKLTVGIIAILHKLLFFNGAPSRTRTCGLLLRRHTPYIVNTQLKPLFTDSLVDTKKITSNHKKIIDISGLQKKESNQRKKYYLFNIIYI